MKPSTNDFPTTKNPTPFMLTLKIALKDILNHKRFSLLFVANLSFGLIGLALIQNLSVIIEDALQSRSKSVLGADLSVGARRALTEKENEILNKNLPNKTESTKTFESFTMLAGNNNTRLVEMKAIQKDYPYYGEIELSRRGIINNKNNFPLFESHRLWVFPELLIQLNLKVGDEVSLGKIKFIIDDTIIRDSSSVGSGFSFAPPIYLAYESLEQTGLMTHASRGYHAILLKLPNEVKNSDLATLLNKELTDPAIQIVTNQKASEQVGRALSYLSDFLGLAGLVAMFLTAIGQFFLFRNYITRRYNDIAIYRSIGMNNKSIFQIYTSQVLILSFISFFITMLVSYAISPLLIPIIEDILQIPIQMTFSKRTWLTLTMTALWGGFLTSLPLLLQALKVRAKDLLIPNPHIRLSTLEVLISVLPVFFIFSLLSVIVANSINTGLTFVVGMTAASILAYGASYYLFRMLEYIPQKNIYLKLSIRQILRDRFSSVTVFIVLCLSVTLTSLLPQIEAGIKEELETPKGLNQPSLFMFDIQDDQLDSILSYIQIKNIKPMQTSPMVRARLSQINEKPFEKSSVSNAAMTREEENENRFRNRGFNLSYRSELSDSEKIYKGKDFPDVKSNYPKISLEQRFAKRLDLKINDILDFDIQGINVRGQVVNLRHVRWTSFQPNFFIQFDNGVLEDAPKTHLITLPNMSDEIKSQIQNDLVRSFPNVSIIDVSRLVERISSIIGQMSFALTIMSLFTILVGVVVLYAIQVLQAYYRRQNTNLIKVLGANHFFLSKLVIIESGIVALLAIISGIIIARIINVLLATQLFEGLYRFDYKSEFVVFGLFISIIVVMTYWTTRNLLKEKPQSLFQSA
jgi:putative ABC transport system permease protein